MNKRIISFICAGLIAISCVSSLCFYDYLSTDGIIPNATYWIFYFFQIFILLGQAGMGIYTINTLLRQKKEAVSFLNYFATHLPLQNMTLLLQTWAVPSITEYPIRLLMCRVVFNIFLLLSLLINEPSSLFRESEYVPRILMATFYVNCTCLALTIIGTIIAL